MRESGREGGGPLGEIGAAESEVDDPLRGFKERERSRESDLQRKERETHARKEDLAAQNHVFIRLVHLTPFGSGVAKNTVELLLYDGTTKILCPCF